MDVAFRRRAAAHHGRTLAGAGRARDGAAGRRARGVLIVRSRLLWVLLIILGIGMLALVLRHDQGTIAGFETGDFASLVYKIALLIFIGGAVLALFRERVAEAFQAAVFWVVIGLLLALGYTYRHDLRDISERVMAELVPGRAVSRGGGTVEIAGGERGEFQVSAEINGARVATVYDTGASAV